MSIVIERARVRGEPGKWWPARKTTADYQDGGMSAILVCPKCNRSMSLLNHSIASDGSVGPSIVCPYGPRVECPNASCGWHEIVKLAGWPP